MILLASLAYIVLGVLAGMLSGLLGISGGVITVPVLFFIFEYVGLPQATIMHYAIGTSLTSMIFNSVTSTWYHNKKGFVEWQTVKHMALGIILGSIAGALIAEIMSGIVLEIFFGVFACLLGVHLLRSKEIKPITNTPSPVLLNTMGFIIGCISNMLGIGGGSMVVPLLLIFGVSDKKAIGTSAATGLLITALGSISYLTYGLSAPEYPYAVSYLYLPAFVLISITTFFSAPFGARLSHKMDTIKLRRIFACIMLLIGLVMLFG